MTHMIQTLRDRMNRQIAYRRTVNELLALSLNSRLDLDIAGIEDKVAARAVWG
ncbi:hypothetical protein [Puniceibacterium sp. IMCC21224]|uniref:hypothetical protein n=1 Tax=Puniceibacterium sp. IMCC21224 TaxID=1618204 RepID=UPI00065CE89E|nr:hypothetical protein [Puniceibacterium sp. IMCC21224]KMK67415.1 hypothetical protein IMCC21224_112284 [Puniceibacterium sp. IMCC21224]